MAVTLLVQVRFRPVCEPNGHLRPLRNTGVRSEDLLAPGPTFSISHSGRTRDHQTRNLGMGRGGWAIPTYFVLTLLKIGWWCRAILCSRYCFVLYCIVLYILYRYVV